MAGTVQYKNIAGNVHRKRYLTNVDNFASGMKYTNSPHTLGYAKSLVNFDIKNDGESLTPRGGIKEIVHRASELVADDKFVDYCVHHASAMYISVADKSDAILCNYYLVGGTTDAGFDVSTANLVVEYNNRYITAGRRARAINGMLLMKPAISTIQDISLDSPKSRTGIYTTIEGNTYMLINVGDVNKLCRLTAEFDATYSTVLWDVEEVIPKDVQPTTAMNYGYNMFKSDPYTFTNTMSATGAIQLTGVVPYSEDGKLLLSARPGTPIVFKLYYKYPQSDVDNNDKYLVQWEIQDLANASEAEVIVKYRNSEQYTPGSTIQFVYTPSHTSFSIIVRLYKQSEITAQDAVWDSDKALQALITKDAYVTPNQVTTLASYYLTSNNNNSTLNVDAVAYDMGTATGMCAWQQRLVMWGVKNAKSTLFVSEINDPGYMPYPNNCEIFADDIVCAVPYLRNLLVFTKSALYKLSIADDGLTYTSNCIQERLHMDFADSSTITTVQNMVYFKSGNYYYMVVPNSLSATSDTQLAPVSRPIEQMLDDAYNTIKGALSDVYNITFTGQFNPMDFTVIDYYVQSVGNQIRNIYKVKATKRDRLTAEVIRDYFIDVSLNYDTVLRAWTVYMCEATPFRMGVYKPTVTGNTVFVNLTKVGNMVYSSLVHFDNTDPKDDFELVDSVARTYGNWQYIDTGYRDFSEDLKKRFREIQFSVNTLEQAKLKFYTAFTVDDIATAPLYTYNVEQYTDKGDPNYGTIYVERNLNENAADEALGVTELGNWVLDTSQFPDITVHKVRLKVSGKGYGGSIKILSTNEVAFELLRINWVYRIMFGR